MAVGLGFALRGGLLALLLVEPFLLGLLDRKLVRLGVQPEPVACNFVRVELYPCGCAKERVSERVMETGDGDGDGVGRKMKVEERCSLKMVFFSLYSSPASVRMREPKL